MKIAVLCGGVSSEREISLRSSSKVAKALRSRGHQVTMIDVFFGAEKEPSFEEPQDYDHTANELRSKGAVITEEQIRNTGLFGPHVLDVCRKADVVFIGLHGENGEDGKVQAVFDRENIPYTGSDAESSALAMSKALTKSRVASHVRMPRGFVIRRQNGENASECLKQAENIPIPCVMKPSNGGSSVGVVFVNDLEQAENALQSCFQYDNTVLVEEFIDGRELTQAVLNGKALPPVEICPDEGSWYDYTNKYSGATREICPAQIPDEVLKEMSASSVRFGEILGLSIYYRIDYILDKNGVLYALEANSLPGMTDTSLVPQEAAAVGISYPDLCEKIIELSLKHRLARKLSNKISEGVTGLIRR